MQRSAGVVVSQFEFFFNAKTQRPTKLAKGLCYVCKLNHALESLGDFACLASLREKKFH